MGLQEGLEDPKKGKGESKLQIKTQWDTGWGSNIGAIGSQGMVSAGLWLFLIPLRHNRMKFA
jgi:hypothetical protein